MTQDEAHRRLERSTEFRFEGHRVRVRDPRWLRAIDALRHEDAATWAVPADERLSCLRVAPTPTRRLGAQRPSGGAARR